LRHNDLTWYTYRKQQAFGITMNTLVNWAIKTSLSAIVWVFVLSVEYDQRTLFSYANELLVENRIFQKVEGYAKMLWHNLANDVEIAITSPEVHTQGQKIQIQ
jgi:hypothetical protein